MCRRWDLDIAHGYRLLADADHLGPTLLPRIRTAFTWMGERLAPRPAERTDRERAWTVWLEGGSQGDPPCQAGLVLFPRNSDNVAAQH